MNITYCRKKCPKGKEKSNELLNESESAYDAAVDFVAFTNDCFSTCPFKDKHSDYKEDIK